MTELVLGPLLRYIDDDTATVWVETDRPCAVRVLDSVAPTFCVAGHHYALVTVRGLDGPTPYEVHLDGERVWPRDGAAPSIIRPVDDPERLTAMFGSCHFDRTAGDGRDREGPDALTACAAQLASAPEPDHPDVLLLLGDQVYADQTTPSVRRELAARRSLHRPPGHEIANFEEYTILYRYAWSDPQVRWLLSTVPSMMIFDDHDVRDDWNTSRAWREQMSAHPWWRERLLGGLISYWIYQHIGNLSPDELERDEVYLEATRVGRHGDALPVLREMAAAADREEHGTKGVRFSYARDLGPARLIVLDTRCGRILETADRAMLSKTDFAWLRALAEVDRRHLVIGCSLPWLLPPAVHHAQTWNERACHRGSRLAEQVRQGADLEHWAAFRDSFDRLAELLGDTAASMHAPATINVLSGDVHHSYLAEAHYPRPLRSRVTQLTCSPLHNRAPRWMRAPLRLAWSDALARRLRSRAERAGAAPLPLRWRKTDGPFFDNTIAELHFAGPSARVRLLEATSHGDLAEICHRRLH
ncbi:alkaline phosphatase D family protein [Saccharopolyspora griseoalba]|uniref:Alkaline phosphatase D family protein n=1 Tax=Saccharopolyspora griseoalba TaxID=1431848 RepID=A0ABW2LFM2_9PSEU